MFLLSLQRKFHEKAQGRETPSLTRSVRKTLGIEEPRDSPKSSCETRDSRNKRPRQQRSSSAHSLTRRWLVTNWLLRLGNGREALLGQTLFFSFLSFCPVCSLRLPYLPKRGRPSSSNLATEKGGIKTSVVRHQKKNEKYIGIISNKKGQNISKKWRACMQNGNWVA